MVSDHIDPFDRKVYKERVEFDDVIKHPQSYPDEVVEKVEKIKKDEK